LCYSVGTCLSACSCFRGSVGKRNRRRCGLCHCICRSRRVARCLSCGESACHGASWVRRSRACRSLSTGFCNTCCITWSPGSARCPRPRDGRSVGRRIRSRLSRSPCLCVRDRCRNCATRCHCTSRCIAWCISCRLCLRPCVCTSVASSDGCSPRRCHRPCLSCTDGK